MLRKFTMQSSREKIFEKIKEGAGIVSQIPSSSNDFEKEIDEGLKAITPRSDEALVEQFKNELEFGITRKIFRRPANGHSL